MYTASVTLSSSQLKSLTLSSSLQLTSLTLSSSLQVTSVTFLFSSANVTRSCSSHSCGVGHCDSGQSIGTYYLLTPLWHWSLCQRSVNWYILPSHSTVALVTVSAISQLVLTTFSLHCGTGHCVSDQSTGTYYLLTPLWHWSLCQRSVNWYLLPSHSTVALVTVTAAGVCLVHTGWLAGGRSLDQPDVSEREVSHVQGF